MRKLDVSTYGMEEMKQQEIADVNGGHPLALALSILGAGIYIYNNIDDFIDGVKEGYERTRK